MLWNHWGPCFDCLNKFLPDISGSVILAPFIIAGGILGDVFGDDGDSWDRVVFLYDDFSHYVGSILEFAGELFEAIIFCAAPCNITKTPQCPDYLQVAPFGEPGWYTRYDGANYMYGYYMSPPVSPCSAFIISYLYDYCPYGGIPNTAHCTDGNLNVPWFLPGTNSKNFASTGSYDGAHCVFGYYEPGFNPFIAGSAFYVNPKCSV